ncbi:MAG TPA: hypothetical protein VNH19_08415, partial [Candidatus Limnocylindrales bacterium]|nr:hypothetical protein [Candidatus Limnocylindrales bacterium]
FCADMGSLVPDIAGSSKGVVPEPCANSIPAQIAESMKHPQDPIPAAEPRTEDAKEERKAVLSWEEVEITFLSDERVQIATSSDTETRNYAEFGFEDGRTKSPNLAWVTLRALAELNGTIRQAKDSDWAAVEKRMQEIRRVFRKHFNLSGDPIPFVEGTGYRARFKISCAPSFKS